MLGDEIGVTGRGMGEAGICNQRIFCVEIDSFNLVLRSV